MIAAESIEAPEAVAGMMHRLEKPFDSACLAAVVAQAISTPDCTRPNILYVEDDPYLQEIIGQVVGTAARISRASSISAARARIARDDIDLILLDLELPDGDGIDLLSEIPAHMPVIIFSAYEVAPEIVGRAVSVMTKSRVRETDVVEEIFATLPDPLDPGPSRKIA